MLPDREELLSKADGLRERPIAIEAFWDGDTDGWRVELVAVLKGKPNRHLATLAMGAGLRRGWLRQFWQS